MQTKTRLFTFITISFCLLGLMACKKNIEESAVAPGQTSRSTQMPRSNECNIYYSYSSSPTKILLAKYQDPENMYDFQVNNFSNQNYLPLFQSHYDKNSPELWGLIPGNDNHGYLLTKYEFDTKALSSSDAPFVYTPQYDVRQICKVDEVMECMYVLEGKKGSKGFSNIVQINLNTNQRKVLVSAQDDIVQAVVANSIVYYVKLSDRSLNKYDVMSGKTNLLIKPFFLAGARIVDKIDFNSYNSGNHHYHTIIYKDMPIDDRRMCLFTVDPNNNRIYWMETQRALIDADLPGNPYDRVRPKLKCAELNGHNQITLMQYTKFFEKDKAPESNDDQKQFTLRRGQMEIDPVTQKLYVGSEILQSDPPQWGAYNYMQTNLSMWSFDTKNKSLSFLIKAQPYQNEFFRNPSGWQSGKVLFNSGHPVSPDNPVYKGSLQSFSITKDNDILN